MKLASFLFPGSGGRVQADSDTALIDDVPPTHALDTFAPDTVADSTLMAGPGSHAPAYALPPTMAREETAATSRSRKVRLPWISAMPFRKQVQVLLPTLALSLLLAFGFLWLYFNILTPTLHHSWPLPLTGERSEAMWRLFWGCNFVGVWDELAFINFVFVLLCRCFDYREANFAQAVFFASFLHEMAFVGWGPPVLYGFALIQGLTYRRTGSLLYIVVLHLLLDSVLFYMIANRWYPGWGWHP